MIQRRVHSPELLGPARPQHLQRLQRAGRRRRGCAGAPRDRPHSDHPRHRAHRQRQPRVAGGRSAAERSRDGLARPHVQGRGQAAGVGQAAARSSRCTATTACSGPFAAITAASTVLYKALCRSGVRTALVAVEPDRPRRAERRDLVRAPPEPSAERRRVHDDGIQLRVVLRVVGAALRDDAHLRRRADRSLLRGPEQRADRPGAARHGGLRGRVGRAPPATPAPKPPTTPRASSSARSWMASSSRPNWSSACSTASAKWWSTIRAPTTSASGPTEEDLGLGNNDPFGNPLSFIKLLTLPPNQIPSQELLTFPIPNIANPPIADRRAVADRMARSRSRACATSS